MKVKILYAFPIGLFMVLLTSCSNDDDIVVCGTPPPEIIFEVVDKNEENLIEHNTIDAETIKAYELSENEKPKHTKHQLTEDSKIRLGEIGFQEGPRAYKVDLGEKTLEITGEVVVHKSDNGCKASLLKEVDFLNVEWNDDDYAEKGYYQVVL